jgi:hypothetical protein
LCHVQVPLFDFLPPRRILMVHEGTEKLSDPLQRCERFLCGECQTRTASG